MIRISRRVLATFGAAAIAFALVAGTADALVAAAPVSVAAACAHFRRRR